ncbi:MAG: hypothetical protein WD751_05145 [Anaerolineales bacterium]
MEATPYFAPPEHLIPNFEFPPGAQPMGGGGGGSPISQGAEAIFGSDLSTEEIHTHYAAQMEERGWRFVDDQPAKNGKVTFWELVDEEGSSWAAKLEVFPNEEPVGSYTVRVRLLLPQ